MTSLNTKYKIDITVSPPDGHHAYNTHNAAHSWVTSLEAVNQITCIWIPKMLNITFNFHICSSALQDL